MTCLSFLAQVLWVLGYPDQARQADQEALSLAQELAHPTTLTAALQDIAGLHMLLREARTVQERAEAAVAICSEYGFVLHLAWGTIRCGWALVMQGHGVEGVAQMHQGLIDYRAQGAGSFLLWYLGALAEPHQHLGQTEAGLEALAEAWAHVDKTNERDYEAEWYRLRGELLRMAEGKGRTVEVTPQACFQKAIEVARHQQARSFELRAAMSLSRLWQEQGKEADAQRLLAEVYDRFTEGFGTADVQDAKALLDKLASKR